MHSPKFLVDKSVTFSEAFMFRQKVFSITIKVKNIGQKVFSVTIKMKVFLSEGVFVRSFYAFAYVFVRRI